MSVRDRSPEAAQEASGHDADGSIAGIFAQPERGEPDERRAAETLRALRRRESGGILGIPEAIFFAR